MNPTESTARDLVGRARAGDPEAFDHLVALLTPPLYRVVRRMAADRAEAEAIVQEAWLRAWKHKDQLDPSRPALPWLARIAVNIARDEWRRRRPLEFSDVGESVDQQADDGPRPGIGLEREEARRRLVLAIESLRPEWKTVLALRYDGGLSYAEIAEVAGLPLNTVRTYLHRAHAALRRELEPGDG